MDNSTSQLENKTLTVEALTRYGIKATDGSYYSYSQKLSESAKVKIVPGVTFDALVYHGEKGGKYLNSVDVRPMKAKEVKESLTGQVAMLQNSTVTASPKGKVAIVSDQMTRADWEAKDTRISRQGVIQASVQALSGVVPVTELFVEAEKLANQMLEFVNLK